MPAAVSISALLNCQIQYTAVTCARPHPITVWVYVNYFTYARPVVRRTHASTDCSNALFAKTRLGGASNQRRTKCNPAIPQHCTNVVPCWRHHKHPCTRGNSERPRRKLPVPWGGATHSPHLCFPEVADAGTSGIVDHQQITVAYLGQRPTQAGQYTR